MKRIHTVTLALGIAVLPPIWAVLAPYLGVKFGAVALICAGLFVANGNNRANACKIIIGFLLGDVWAVSAIWIMGGLPFHPDVVLYGTLFFLGALAVFIGEKFARWIFTPSWLCGWAIGLTIMGSMSISKLGSIPLQIGAAMVVGVLYVGIGVDMFQQFLIQHITSKKSE